MDATTGIILVILLVIGFLWARSSRKKKELPPDDDPRLKVNLGEGTPTVPSPEPGPTVNMGQTMGRNQRSLDAEYALSHGMWVCERCETLNENTLYNCKACGASK